MSTKRKAAAAASPTTIDLRPNKRHKSPNAGSEVEHTSDVGLRFIDQLRNASDKNGRSITSAFFELPDKDELPDYYEITKLPIAIATVEEKLRKRQYHSLSEVEGDIKRMVQNAKDYNETSSDIYNDAERIRKLTHNFMKIHNSAYKDSEYRAQPTAIPDDLTPQPAAHAAAPPGPKIRLNTAKKEVATPARQSSRTATLAATAGATAAPTPPQEPAALGTADTKATIEKSDDPYQGLDFQGAQEKVLEELMDHMNESNELDFAAIFGNLPSRSLVDYYKTIKEPQSLKKISKSVKGWRSREDITGITEFKTWDALENELSKVWRNAMEYNVEGSDVYQAALQLEAFTKERLLEAKKRVREPQTSIKLKTGADKSKSGLKLNLGTSAKQSPAPVATAQGTESPAPKPAQTSVTVDYAALQRQQADVKTAAGVANRGPPTISNVPSLPLGGQGVPNGTTNGLALATNGVAPVGRPLSSNAGSPFPMQGLAASQPVATQPMSTFDNKWRQEGREALIRKLHIEGPEGRSSKPFQYTISAHAKLAQQSITINLPGALDSLQARFDLAAALQGTLGRPSKVFATVNGMRVPQRPDALSNGSGNIRSPMPTFDLRLAPGMNRIELECTAVGQPKNGNLRGELEMERFYIFANVLKG